MNDQLVDFGFFDWKKINSTGTSTGAIGTIAWSRSFVDGSYSETLRYALRMDIPVQNLASITLKFFAETNEALSNESGGIDDLVIISCPQIGQLTN